MPSESIGPLIARLLRPWIAEADALLVALIVSSVVVVWFPGALDRTLRRLYDWSQRPLLVALFVAVVPVVLRLALLPWWPAPRPFIHDEFSHLLVADTLASGRLANPTHPFWRHFETIYVLQNPTYSSEYPLGYGATLALGKFLFGHPWAGVLLTVALMNVAIYWMARGVLTHQWAAVAALIASFQFGGAGAWMNSYLGGALAGASGALVFGALVRFPKSPSYFLATLVGIGLGVHWHLRPYETIWLTFGCGLWLVSRFNQSRGNKSTAIRALMAPLLTCVLAAAAVTALHNYRVTGDAFTLPYQLSRQTYGTPVAFFWQSEPSGLHFSFKNIEQAYRWQLEQKLKGDDLRLLTFEYGSRVFRLWRLNISPALTVALIAALAFRVRIGLPVLLFIGLAFLGAGFYPFFFDHYVAAYSCLWVALATSGVRELWMWRGRVGRILALFSVLAVVFVATGQMSAARENVPSRSPETQWDFAARLRQQEGKDLVFVRYSDTHDFHKEWVYNEANIDSAEIVWAREIDPGSDRALIEYFNGRQVWVLEPDRTPIALYPYPKPR